MALISTSEYKTHAGIAGSGSDTLIAAKILAAEAMIARITGRTFEQATLTELYDGTGTPVLQLRSWPVGSITSVEDRGVGSTYTTIDASLYRVNTLNGCLVRLGAIDSFVDAELWDQYGAIVPYVFSTFPVWPKGEQNIRVVYQGGFATVPNDLKQATFEIVDALIRSAGRDPTVSQESIGDYSYTRPTAPYTGLGGGGSSAAAFDFALKRLAAWRRWVV